MNRRELLEAAGARVLSGEATYGKPEDNFTRIAEALNALDFRVDGNPLLASDVAVMLIVVKLARQMHAPKTDNWVDIAGYAACGAEVDSE